jgi:hypothetical protein
MVTRRKEYACEHLNRVRFIEMFAMGTEGKSDMLSQTDKVESEKDANSVKKSARGNRNRR